MDKDLLYNLGFSYCPGIGPVRYRKMINAFKSTPKAYWCHKDQLETIIGEEAARNFIGFRNVFDPVVKLEELKKQEVKVIIQDNPRYPDNLKNISDPPICLYIKGELAKGDFFSIIGTRQPTLYGQKVAYEISFGLAKSGFTVVSGMAEGIDGVAHWAAIDAKAPTIAVLGCVDSVYPKTNSDLYRKIITSGGAVVSEFPPGNRLLKGMFISRNRIVSGISRGILVVEGTDRSGTLVTASYAANQGRDIFAVPGQITQESSLAPNILIKQGAKLVTQVEDILTEYGVKRC